MHHTSPILRRSSYRRLFFVAVAGIMLVGLLSTADAQVGGKKQKGGKPILLPGGFMGIKGKATDKYIVIIADRSGSMYAGKVWYDYKTKQEKRGKKAAIDYLKEELLKTIDSVAKNNASIYVILYDGPNSIEEQPTGGKYAFLPADIKKVTAWVKKIKPKGDTDPAPAFKVAFNLQPTPDVIYFMSDGIIPKAKNFGLQLGKDWAKLKKRPTIHTIQLETPGRDPASVLMSRYPGPFRPPQINGAIANSKLIWTQMLSNPKAVKKMKDEENNQRNLMDRIAKGTGGKFKQIKNLTGK